MNKFCPICKVALIKIGHFSYKRNAMWYDNYCINIEFPHFYEEEYVVDDLIYIRAQLESYNSNIYRCENSKG